MVTQLILGLAFAMAPVMELRAAIPLLINYSLQQGISPIPLTLLAILLNILTIIIVMTFLDLLHKHLLKIRWYRHLWNQWIHTKLRKKIKKLEKNHKDKPYLGLLLFISLPLPGTGVWTSTTISWILGMNRIKSFITIAIGASIAGMIIFFISLGLLSSFFY